MLFETFSVQLEFEILMHIIISNSLKVIVTGFKNLLFNHFLK